MKKFNKIFAVCLTLSVLGGSLLPSPWTCGGFTEPVSIEVQADGEPTTIDSGIGVLITMLLANGIRFVGNFDDTVKPGIQKLWDDFTTATGNTVTLATLGTQSVISLGYLRTSSAVNNAVTAFQQWYQNTFSVPSSGDVTITTGAGVGSYIQSSANSIFSFTASTGTTFYFNQTEPARYVVLKTTDNWAALYAVYTSSFKYKEGTSSSVAGNLSNGKNAYSYTYENVIYYMGKVSQTSNVDFFAPLNPSYYPGSNSHSYDVDPNAILYTYGSGAVIGDTSMTGQTLELKDGFNISNDQAKLIDIAGLESLVGTLGLTLENVNDLIDSIPLIMDYPWADTFPDDPTFADTPDDAIPWVDVPTAVVPAEVPEYVPETPADEGSYKVLGLERVFPFSIPFDFVAVVNLLNAEPVCPEFTFRVYNPISGQNIDATMSFERFEAVAQVIRIVETIGFIVFLILITRSLIRS